MSITSDLEQILSARYGKDVRQAIHDSIEEGYNIAVQAQGTAETSADSAEAYAAAALASEQNAQDYMELAEQYKNEAFSGTPTGYSDLVAKVNSIYKQTASSFGVVDTVEGLALAHTIYGMSEQDGTPTPSVPVGIKNAKANFKCVGKNLISYPYKDGLGKEVYGITFTVNSEDGTITASGTASGYSTFNISTRLQGDVNDIIIPNGSYKISGSPSKTGCRLLALRTYNGAANTLGDDVAGSGATFTANGDDFSTNNVNLGIQIAIMQGTVLIPPVVFKPMLTYSDVQNSDYAHFEPYKHKDITTNLILRAIEVTSADDYNLVKDGKYYVADTLDWDEDSGYSITRRIGNIDSYDSESLTTIWMSSKDVYAEGTTPTAGANVTYILTTTTSESVTSAQAQALLGLKTYDEATTIDSTGDVAPSVTLEYSKDRTTALGLMSHNLAHINSLKIADLS